MVPVGDAVFLVVDGHKRLEVVLNLLPLGGNIRNNLPQRGLDRVHLLLDRGDALLGVANLLYVRCFSLDQCFVL